MKKILVPIDFSEGSEKIYNYLKALGGNNNLEVTLFHLAELPVMPGNFMTSMDYVGDLMENMLKAFEKRLLDLAQQDYWKGMKLNTEFVTDPGTTADEAICRHANEGNYDLVVLYSKHSGVADGFLLGSVLNRILRKCHVPMLVLSPESALNLNRAVYATDFSKESADVFKVALDTNSWLSGDLTMCKVTTPEEFEDQRDFNTKRIEFGNLVGFENIREVTNYNAWNLERGIMQFAEDQLAELIIMGTHGRKGLSRLFNRSITESTISNTQQAVLVVNMQA